MNPRHLFTLTIAALIISMLGCSGISSPPADNGPAADDNPPSPAIKSASSTFTRFFQDNVGTGSGSNWSISNSSGQKFWQLSNTCFSTPKAWVIGQNYWNGENDRITSIGFTVPNNKIGIKLAFYSRWNILAGDFGRVDYSVNNGSTWTQVQAFTSGSNPAYPDWTKYTYALPDNLSGSAQTWRIRFRFTSDSSNVGWGFGVDTISVYQTDPNPPINVTATDGTLSGQVDVDWDHGAGDAPDSYLVFRAPDNGGAPGTYNLLATVAYPASAYSDNNGTGNFYWYMVRARKSGYSDSSNSNQDTGYGIGTWMKTGVNASQDVGQFSSLAALASGKPAISYRDATLQDLLYAYSTTADGSSGWITVNVDQTGDVGEHCSLAIVNGKPAISYYDITNTNLKYAYSSTADGSSGWTAIDADNSGSCGQYTSLAVVNGKPAISYYDSTLNLRYAYSSQIDGSSGWTSVTADSSPSTGIYTSLAVVNGKPAIAYYDGTNQDLKYAYSSQVDGSSGWTSLGVDTSGNVGIYPSLAVVSGKPAISYFDNTSQNLKYAYSSQANGSSGWTSLPVDSTGIVGEWTSLAVIYGKPAISYYDGTNTDLKFAISTQANGSSGWSSVGVDTNGAEVIGDYTSLTMIDGGPAISYRDATNTQLKFAWLQ